ncbi:MAG: acetoacetate decarboxylase [Rudaea sp.]
MTEDEIRRNAFAMPIDNPAFPPGPYLFVDREYLIITYRTDPDALRRIIPAPLEMTDPVVKYEFIRMPDSTGFGDYTESGQVIPIRHKGEAGGYVRMMFLDDHPPTAGGREIWGFPKKIGEPTLRVHRDTLVGELKYSDMPVARGTMGYKYAPMDEQKAIAGLEAPAYLLKIIPHVDGKPRICELVKYAMQCKKFKGAWTGPGALELYAHALAPVADLPVLEIVSAAHFKADLLLPYGEVVHDYLA